MTLRTPLSTKVLSPQVYPIENSGATAASLSSGGKTWKVDAVSLLWCCGGHFSSELMEIGQTSGLTWYPAVAEGGEKRGQGEECDMRGERMRRPREGCPGEEGGQH